MIFALYKKTALAFILLVYLLHIAACQKDKCKADTIQVPTFDSTIVLSLQAPPVRMQFSDSEFMDFSMVDGVQESRCPDCPLLDSIQQCSYNGWAYAQLMVKNEKNQSYTYQCSFFSCYHEYDTTQTVRFIPLNQCIVFPLSLLPYPTVQHPVSTNYVLKIRVMK